MNKFFVKNKFSRGGHVISSKGAIFDLDGTLLDSLHIWEQIDIRFLEKRGFTATKDYTQAVTPLGFQRAAEYTIARFGLTETIEEVVDEWNQMTEQAYAAEIKLKPNALDYLLYLKKTGTKLGVATALRPDSVESVLKNNGIHHMFDSFTMLHEVSRGKEFPDIYLLAARKLALPPSSCIVYEDILAAVKGAKSGGFRVCGVYDSYSGDQWAEIVAMSDFAVRDYAELMEQV